MPPRPEVLGDRAVRRQKALGMTRRFEALHAPLALTRRPMPVFTPVVEIPTLAMLYPWEKLALGRAVALQFVGNKWLRVLDTAKRSQVDQRVRHQLHPIVPLLDAFKP